MASRKKINPCYALKVFHQAVVEEFGSIQDKDIILKRIPLSMLKQLFDKIRKNEPIMLAGEQMEVIAWRYAHNDQWAKSDSIKAEDFSNFEVYKIKRYILLKKYGTYLQLFSENEEMIN